VAASVWATVMQAFEHPREAAAGLRDELEQATDPARRWVLRVALDEAAGDGGPAGVEALARLVDELAAAGVDVDVQVWARTVLAERAAARFDPISVPVARDALALLPDGPLLSPVALLARARLHRLLAFLWLVLPGDNGDASDRHHDQALRDFERCGLDAHAAFTTVMHSGLHIGLVGDDPLGRLARIEEAQAVLDGHDTALRGDGEVVVAVVAGLLGDFDRFRRALDSFAARRHEPGLSWSPVEADLVIGLLGAFGDLLEGRDGPGARARLDAEIEGARRIDRWLSVLALHAGAVVLANLGDLDGARGCWDRAQAYPAPFVTVGQAHLVLPHRLSILGGDASAVAPLKEVLNRLVGEGRGGLAATQALTAAVDCRRVGDHAHADLLLAFALEHLGPPDRWAPADAAMAARAAAHDDGPGRPHGGRLAEPAGSTGSGRSVGTGVRIRLLAPQVDVVVDGETVVLTPSVARLLAVLLTQPSPMTVDQLVERLWPDSEPAAARRRLASALHRLRAGLGVGRHELVVRHGDALTVILPEHWRIDVVDFRRARRRGDDALLADAVTAVTGAVASVQLAYDDALADVRHAFVADWLAAAGDLCRRGVLTAADLTGPLVALDLDADDLPPGLRGPNAETGLRGPNAETGLRGPNAETGLRGPNAETGLRGPNAETGIG
jgi:hypothetical protein